MGGTEIYQPLDFAINQFLKPEAPPKKGKGAMEVMRKKIYKIKGQKEEDAVMEDPEKKERPVNKRIFLLTDGAVS